MPDYAARIGRQQTVADVAAADRVAGLMALLDDPAPYPTRCRRSAIGCLPGRWRGNRTSTWTGIRCAADGLLPPIALPRRMWAASEIAFFAPIPLDAPVERRTTVAAITPKHGRSGAMLFVTLDHDVVTGNPIAIRERQHIVYREPAAAPPASGVAQPDLPAPPAAAEASRVVTADAVALFRYSAQTFNAHRIHYDRDYAALEGYPGLVVQGPFAATLLLDHARRQRPGADVARIAFRARAPLFADHPFTLAMAGDQLWIVDAEGAVTMTAEVGWA